MASSAKPPLTASAQNAFAANTIDGDSSSTEVTGDDSIDTEALARETDTSVDLVAKIYRQEWTSLASEAKITQFLGVLATRRVRMMLRKNSS